MHNNPELENFKLIADWLNKLCKKHHVDAEATCDSTGTTLTSKRESSFALIMIWNGEDFYLKYKGSDHYQPYTPLTGIFSVKCVVQEMLMKFLCSEINFAMRPKKNDYKK